jgi:hypothetical protein
MEEDEVTQKKYAVAGGFERHCLLPRDRLENPPRPPRGVPTRPALEV